MGVERELVRASYATEQPRYRQWWTESRARGLTDRATELSIQLLGDFGVWIGLRRIEEAEWYLRKPKNLVQLLALAADHRMTREELVELLWPALDREAGLGILGKAVLVAQRVFQPGLSPTAPSAYLRLEREWIVLDPPGQLWVDVDAFRQAVETAQATQRQTDYERAQCLYRGDLLPDDRFEDWTVEPRERLRALRLTLPMPRAWQDQPPGERELLWCPVERL